MLPARHDDDDMMILNAYSFNVLDIFFLSLSSLGPFGFLMIIRPSSLYSPISVC